MVWNLAVSFVIGLAAGFTIGFITGVEIRTLDKSGFRRVLAIIAAILLAVALYAEIAVLEADIPIFIYGIIGGVFAYYFKTADMDMGLE